MNLLGLPPAGGKILTSSGEDRKAHKRQVLAYIEQHFQLTDADRELEEKSSRRVGNEGCVGRVGHAAGW